LAAGPANCRSPATEAQMEAFGNGFSACLERKGYITRF